MGMRDLALGLLLLASIPFAVMRPFFGLLVFSWLAYMRAPDMTWTVGLYRPSLWIGIATVAGVLLHREERLMVLEKRTVLLGLFFAAVAVSALVAPDIAAAAGSESFFAFASRIGSKGEQHGSLIDLAKVVFIALLTTGLVRTPDRVRLLLLVVAGSLGLLALKTLVQGALNTGLVMHGPGGGIGDNNDYGLALVMTLPLLVYVAREEKGFLMRVVLCGMAVACVGGVLLTRSRGGAVALAVMAFVWIVTLRKNPWALILAPLALAAVAVLTPHEFVGRLRSLTAGAPDPSTQGRIVAWEKAANMAGERPVFGVGPGNFMTYWDSVPPESTAAPIVAHNTYLQILAESGVVTLAIYIVLLGITLGSLAYTRWKAEESWRASYAHAVFLSLVGFMAGAMFLSRTHFDLLYHLVGISVAIGIARPGPAFDWFGWSRWWRPPVGSPDVGGGQARGA